MEPHLHTDTEMQKSHYRKFAWMIVLSFMSMYALMYAMVDQFANIIPNVNQIYMAALMTAPMILIEILLMGNMYKNKKLNYGILAIGVLLLIVSFLLIRNQTAVGDKQFLKSMIPHHAGAVLMVKKADLTDPEVKKLAADIITSQQKEIAFMKAKIKELENK